MKYGESIFGCLERELEEELEIDINFATEPKLVRVYDYLHPQDQVQRVYIVYIYQLPEKITISSAVAEWISIEKINHLKQNDQWKQMILDGLKLRN